MVVKDGFVVYHQADNEVLRFKIGGYHVRIIDEDGKTIFQRGDYPRTDADPMGTGENWLDKPHRRITDAIKELEEALLEAARPS